MRWARERPRSAAGEKHFFGAAKGPQDPHSTIEKKKGEKKKEEEKKEKKREKERKEKERRKKEKRKEKKKKRKRKRKKKKEEGEKGRIVKKGKDPRRRRP